MSDNKRIDADRDARLQKALDNNFRGYTSEELDEFGRDLGVKFQSKTPSDKKISELLAACGRTTDYVPEPVPADAQIAVSDVLPPYSLIFENGWGGRRHRIILFRPDDVSPKQAGELFFINGLQVPIRYEPEVTIVPEPFLAMLKNPVKTRGEIKRTVDDEGFTQLHSIIHYERKYKYSYEGVDEATADRAGSVQEFYRKKGRAWFDQLDGQQLRQIAAYLMKPLKDKQDRPLDAEMLRAILAEEFFPGTSLVAARVA